MELNLEILFDKKMFNMNIIDVKYLLLVLIKILRCMKSNQKK